MNRAFIKKMVFVMIILVLSGCNKGPELKPKTNEEEKMTKVAISIQNSIHDDNKILKKTLTEKGKKEDMEIIWLDAQNNAVKQQDDIKKAVEEKIKVMVIEPVEADLLGESIKELQKKNIKVICLSSMPPDMEIDALISPDYYRAGEMQAQQVVKNNKAVQDISVLILRGPKGNTIADNITEGNISVFQDNKRVKQIWIEEIKDPNTGLEIKQVLSKYIENNQIPQAVLAHSPAVTQLMLELKKELLGAEINIETYGMGTQYQVIKAIEADEHDGEVDYRPEMMAQIVLDTADDLSNDEPWEYEKQIENGSYTIPTRITPLRSISKGNVFMLKDRMETLEKENDAKSNNDNEKEEEQNTNKEESKAKENEQNSEGNEGNTKVIIKTKDGQKFEMSIKGQIESVEMMEEKQEKGGNQEEEEKSTEE